MSYDPNQPQQPQPPYGQPQYPYEQQWGQQPPSQYGQPQQPPYQQPWGQQPPQDYAPTQYGAPAYGNQPTPGYMPPQQPRRSRRGLWIVLGIIGGLIVLSCAACGILFVAGVGFFANTAAAPTMIVNQYYDAVKKQDYSMAYSYIDQNLYTDNGQTTEKLTQQVYMLAAQDLDTREGNVTKYSVGKISLDYYNTAFVTVTVTRGSYPAYDVQLQLKQINGSWKITYYDKI